MGEQKILIVDDDINICTSLKSSLEKEGYDTITANDGEDAVFKFNSQHPDFIILDIVLPKMDGWQVCREIRKTSLTPIIFLSIKSDTFDKVLGLELGGDDYMTKPFNIKELIARIKAISRRNKNVDVSPNSKIITYDKMQINLTNYELILDSKQVHIAAKELELLYHLAKSPNKVFSRDQLLEGVWNFEYYGNSRTVDVHVKRLRDVIDGVSDKWRLKTIWGTGYKFEVDK